MRNLEVKSSNLRLAQLRYYELERHASEILDNKAFAVILEVNTFNKDEDGNYIYNYINVFNPLETLPVFDRTRPQQNGHWSKPYRRHPRGYQRHAPQWHHHFMQMVPVPHPHPRIRPTHRQTQRFPVHPFHAHVYE